MARRSTSTIPGGSSEVRSPVKRRADDGRGPGSAKRFMADNQDEASKKEQIEEYEEDRSDEDEIVANYESTSQSQTISEEDDEMSRSSTTGQTVDDDEEDFDDTESVDVRIEIGPIDAEFRKACNILNAPLASTEMAWETYYIATQRVALEGNQRPWQAVALFYILTSKSLGTRRRPVKLLTSPLPATLNQLIEAFSISSVEFFDKMARFSEVMQSNRVRRVAEYVKKLQESLAVSAVIYKKYLPIYRTLFLEVSENEQRFSDVPSSRELFHLIWTTYLVAKRSIASDELVTCFHLLVCVIESVYADMCSQGEGVEAHIRPSFVDKLLQDDLTVLVAICELFDGVVLDAKHFREHKFQHLRISELPDSFDIKNKMNELTAHVDKKYTEWLLMRGQIDERLFVPEAADFSSVFNDTRDAEAIELLRRGPDNQVFIDATLLLRMSNQNCLERVRNDKATSSTRSSSNATIPFPAYHDGNVQSKNDSTGEDAATQLRTIIGNWNFESSRFRTICGSMRENPAAGIIRKRNDLAEAFWIRVQKETTENPEFDSDFALNIDSHRELVATLFMVYIDKIVSAEVAKRCRVEDLAIILKREPFIDSVFCFCLELVLAAYNSEREFPWSAETLGVSPFVFHRAIDLMVGHEDKLTRSLNLHFNNLDDRIIEELAWAEQSGVWKMLKRCPFNTVETIDNFQRDETDEIQNGPSRNVRSLLKKVLSLASSRLDDLCDRIGMDERSKSLVWSLFEYVIRNETELLMDRHIDQLILCSIYVICKVSHIATTFMRIMAHYRRQPQAKSQIYRQVTVDASLLPNSLDDVTVKIEGTTVLSNGKVKVDVIKFYNLIFRDRVQTMVHELEMATDADLLKMPGPNGKNLTPARINICSTVAVQAMPRTSDRATREEKVIAEMSSKGMTYEVQNSPRKELKSINERVGEPLLVQNHNSLY